MEPTPEQSGGESGANDANTWAVAIHLSQFAGYVVPLAGFIAPFMIWQINKGQYPSLNDHGRVVTNWILSAVIYYAIAILLCLVVIGIFILPILGALSVVFPIIGTIKASKGEVWKYPLSIPFF